MGNYKVVRQGFFETGEEPQLIISNGRIYVNTYAVNLYPEHDYALFLIDEDMKTVILKPFKTKVKDSFKWCSSGKKRRSRKVNAGVLVYKICNLMDWDFYSRYKTGGIRKKSASEDVLFFDLKEAVCFKVTDKYDESGRLIVEKKLPENWDVSFGVSKAEYDRDDVISTYDDDKLFSVELMRS